MRSKKKKLSGLTATREEEFKPKVYPQEFLRLSIIPPAKKDGKQSFLQKN